jgi:hypothetical protein
MFVSTSHSDTTGIRPLTDGELDHVAGGASDTLGLTVGVSLGVVVGADLSAVDNILGQVLGTVDKLVPSLGL